MSDFDQKRQSKVDEAAARHAAARHRGILGPDNGPTHVSLTECPDAGTTAEEAEDDADRLCGADPDAIAELG